LVKKLHRAAASRSPPPPRWRGLRCRRENFDEPPIEELTDRELDLVFGGWMTQLIHMDYHKMDNFNDPTAVRYA
jgi:hypothetical protein